MKSFIFALLMLLSVTVFVVFNANQTVSRIDDMLSLTEILPKNAEEFETMSEQVQLSVYELRELWKHSFPLISFTAGYENTDRCDEAIRSLVIHFENNNGAEFSVSVAEIRDSLSRLRILEGIHWHGIL